MQATERPNPGGLLNFEHQGYPEYEAILPDRTLTDSQPKSLIAGASGILKDRRREQIDTAATEQTSLPNNWSEYMNDAKTSYSLIERPGT